MRLLFYLIIAVSFMFGQIVAASPREDAENIMEQIISENGSRSSLLHDIASFHVLHFRKELAEQSVQVVDADRFAENFPVSVTEPWLVRWQEIFVDILLERHTPEQLNWDVKNLHVLAETTYDSHANRREENRLALTVSLISWASSMKVDSEIRRSVPRLSEAPYLADILEIDGIFAFPNRIWRKDFIAKIRNGV